MTTSICSKIRSDDVSDNYLDEDFRKGNSIYLYLLVFPFDRREKESMLYKHKKEKTTV